MSIKNKENININNIVISLYLSIPMITKIITTFIPLKNNILILTIVLVVVFLTYNIKKIIITKKFIAINLIVFLVFLTSFIIVDDNTYTRKYLLSYLLYGMVGMFFIQYKVEYKKIFKYINIIFILFTFILIYRYIPLVKVSNDLDFTMDLSYSLLVGLTGALINLKYDKSKMMKIITITCILVSLYYLIFLNNNRASIIALLFFVGLCLLKKIRKQKTKIVVCIIGAVLILFSINGILNYLENVNTNINWINRLQYQLRQNNILSDRDKLYIDAVEDIKSNLFLGIGIGKFENNHTGLYTHNLFLQLACENGIFWSIIIGGYIVSCIYRNIMNTEDTEKNMILMFLLIQFIPRLLLSSVHWNNLYIWIWIYMNIREKNEKKESRESVPLEKINASNIEKNYRNSRMIK